MLKFEIDRTKSISFDTIIEGIDTSALSYHFRIKVGDIEYGFEGILKEDKIVFDIPPLNKVSKGVKEGKKYPAKLDIVSDKHYIPSWQGYVALEFEPKIVTKIAGEEGDIKASVSLEGEKIIEKPDPPKEKPKMTSSIFNKYMREQK